MRKETKKALKELLTTVKANLNNVDNFYINQHMPARGIFADIEKDMDENGIWGFVNTTVKVTEQDALKEAQDELLNGLGRADFDEFLFETEIRGKLCDFMRLLCKEYAGC